MSGNSQKMTLEERIVQTLKDDTLMRLVGDEDAITELVIRSLREALFQPVRTVDSCGRGTVEKDSLVVATARATAVKYADTLAKGIMDELLADPVNRKRIRDAMIDFLPQAIERTLAASLQQARALDTFDTIESLRQMKARGLQL